MKTYQGEPSEWQQLLQSSSASGPQIVPISRTGSSVDSSRLLSFNNNGHSSGESRKKSNGSAFQPTTSTSKLHYETGQTNKHLARAAKFSIGPPTPPDSDSLPDQSAPVQINISDVEEETIKTLTLSDLNKANASMPKISRGSEHSMCVTPRSGRHELMTDPQLNVTQKSVAKDFGSIRLSGNGSSATLLSSAPGNLFDTNRLGLVSPPPPDPSATNIHRRCVARNGVANLRHSKISRKNQRFFMDTFTTMVDIEWRFNLLVFALSFVFSWLFFACIWWTVAYQHGDLAPLQTVDTSASIVSQVVSTNFENSIVMTDAEAANITLETSPPPLLTKNWFELFQSALNRSMQKMPSFPERKNFDSNPSSPLSSKSNLQLIQLINALNLTQILNSYNKSEAIDVELVSKQLASQILNFLNLNLSEMIISHPPSTLPSHSQKEDKTTKIVSSSSESSAATISPQSVPKRRPCLDNVRSFSDALLFSIETQHTIGYGTRQPTDECPEVLLLLMLQAITGCLLVGLLSGFVFAKLSRPQKRSQTLVFSKRAVINLCEDPTDFSVANCLDAGQKTNGAFDFNRMTTFGNLSNGLDCDAQEICEMLHLVSTGQLRVSDFQREESLEETFEMENGWEIVDPQCTLQSGSGTSGKRSGIDGSASYSAPEMRAEVFPTLLEPLERVDYGGDQRYRLQFRLGDVREKSHIINARVSAFFLCKENFQLKRDLLPSKEDRAKRKAAHLRCRRNAAVYDPFAGEQIVDNQRTISGIFNGAPSAGCMPSVTMMNGNRCDYGKMMREKKLHNFTQRKLALTIDSAGSLDGELLLIWPLVVSHEINEQSPLWNISRSQLRSCKFEIVVVLEGTIESTGQSIQARTSYLPSEINWGERFLPLLQSEHENAEFSVNFSAFHITRKEMMPSFSAREYALRRKLYHLFELRNCLKVIQDQTEVSNNHSDACSSSPASKDARHPQQPMMMSNQQRKETLIRLLMNAPNSSQLQPNSLAKVLQILPQDGMGAENEKKLRTIAEIDEILELLKDARAFNHSSNIGNCFVNSAMSRQTDPFVQRNLLAQLNQLSLTANSLPNYQWTMGRSSANQYNGISKLVHLFQQQNGLTSNKVGLPTMQSSSHISSTDSTSTNSGPGVGSPRNGHLDQLSENHLENKKFRVNRVETNSSQNSQFLQPTLKSPSPSFHGLIANNQNFATFPSSQRSTKNESVDIQPRTRSPQFRSKPPMMNGDFEERI